MDLSAAIAAIQMALPEVAAVYLFGSRVRGQEGSGSDVDLAVLVPRRMDPPARWSLQEDLAALLHADVDLVDLRSSSAVMRAQVIGTGELLLDRNPAERALFEMYALSDYARLNEERRAIMREVRERGTVYG